MSYSSSCAVSVAAHDADAANIRTIRPAGWLMVALILLDRCLSCNTMLFQGIYVPDCSTLDRLTTDCSGADRGPFDGRMRAARGT
jgi:hypothetical protein